MRPANNSDDSPADGIQGDHAGHHECQHDQGCATLPVAVSPCDHHFGNAGEKCEVKNTRPGWESRSRRPSHLQ